MNERIERCLEIEMWKFRNSTMTNGNTAHVYRYHLSVPHAISFRVAWGDGYLHIPLGVGYCTLQVEGSFHNLYFGDGQ